MTLFDPRDAAEAAEALGGPSWLAEFRRAAAARLAGVAPATAAAEDWRYSRIDDLDVGLYPFAAPEATSCDAGADFVASLGAAALVRLVDGRIASLDAGGSPASVAPLGDARPDGFGELSGGVDEPFAVANDALAPETVVVDVPPRTVVPDPVVVVSDLSAAAEGHTTFSRILVRLGELSEAAVVILQTSADVDAVHVPVVEVVVGSGAHAKLDIVQELGPRVRQLGYSLASVARDATFRSFAGALGGDYARLFTHAALTGEGATSELFAAYVAEGTQMQDFRTFQDHVAGRTRSDLVFKGAVVDHARSVYSGLIRMRKGARRAEASQTNRNLVLSEGAHADSVPNLEIEENDVRCSHASAVGPIDPEQRFYLESRGIAPAVCDRLILLGFFDDLLGRAANPAVAAYVRDAVARRLALSARSAA